MLQIDFKIITVSALALAALAVPAHGETVCNLEDGLAVAATDFAAEAAACEEGIEGLQTQTFLETELTQMTVGLHDANTSRPVAPLSSLKEAARLHARDMAVRGYAAHADPEGRDHLYRVRMIDRSRLFSTFGAGVTVLQAGSTSEQVLEALLSDSAHAANFERAEFTHTGIGAVEADGRLYVVQLFARVDGQLESQLPVTVAEKESVVIRYADASHETDAWTLKTAAGDVLTSGIGRSIQIANLGADTAFLNVNVDTGRGIYTLKGPILASR